MSSSIASPLKASLSKDSTPKGGSPKASSKPASPRAEMPEPARAIQQPTPPESIRAASESGESDEFDLLDETSSSTQSVTSSIYAHTYEHGRRYHSYKHGRYPVPNDDIEQAREDMKHAMMLELTDGKLFYAPIGEHPQKIMDVGTGTGIWAISVGHDYPSASVLGIDLSPIQPLWVPPNVRFLVDDCEDDWIANDVDYDLIHFRSVIVILKQVPRVLSFTFDAVKAGGWIELQEMKFVPYCDDGTMRDDDPVKVLYDRVAEAYGKFGGDITMPGRLGDMLAEAGYTNIQCRIKKVPIGVWAADKTMRLIGMYQKMAILDLMPTFAAKPFKAIGMSDAESEVTLALARRGLNDHNVHRYFNFYFWYAQKPVLVQREEHGALHDGTGTQ